MEASNSTPLSEAWYYGLPGRCLKRGRMLAKALLGERLLFGRDDAGQVFALRDRCPHRGIPLSAGRFDGSEIECCYHGWRFGTDGGCRAIPSLVRGQGLDVSRIRVPARRVREVQGNVWIYWGDDPAAAPDIPLVPGIGDGAPRLVETMRFPGAVDEAVIGLMDPAHGPFVHRSWWWRPRRSIHEKEKLFAPSRCGFTMLRHAPSDNSRAYRLLGGAPETEIRFQLPGIRIEHIRAGRHVVCNLTAVTPVDAETSEVNHAIYWTTPWLTALRPLLRPFVRGFLRQDRDIIALQRQGLGQGLGAGPPLLLVGDADAQARWYYRLKAEYVRAQDERRGFVNPVTPRALRWRS